ncbi:MAG: ATP-binding cassette domain-containing protein [Gammaproteobacteria bacterium]|nr:ATP-binding cassette domain-containing protein [Gammaproteobacteria bacterium]
MARVKNSTSFNGFLFFNNEEIYAKAAVLSGGERARLCLAQISARSPALLVLDEITNNIDLETREHIIQVLKAYPGALLVISHDEAFLREIEVTDYYVCQDKRIHCYENLDNEKL